MGALFAFVAVATDVAGLRDLTFPTLEQREIGVDGVGDFAYAYVFLTSSLKKHTFYNLLINNILYLCVT